MYTNTNVYLFDFNKFMAYRRIFEITSRFRKPNDIRYFINLYIITFERILESVPYENKRLSNDLYIVTYLVCSKQFFNFSRC